MANYTAVITDSGLALLQTIDNAGGTLEMTSVKAGDGELGAGDPQELTAIISVAQTSSVVDIRQDGNGDWFAFVDLSNASLETGYLRREMGLYARQQGVPASETLLVYLYAPTDPDADYIPAYTTGAAVRTTYSVKIVPAAGLTATVSIDLSGEMVTLDRWEQHLTGAGGVDQHVIASATEPGLMSTALFSKLNGLNIGTSYASVRTGDLQPSGGNLPIWTVFSYGIPVNTGTGVLTIQTSGIYMIWFWGEADADGEQIKLQVNGADFMALSQDRSTGGAGFLHPLSAGNTLRIVAGGWVGSIMAAGVMVIRLT